MVWRRFSGFFELHLNFEIISDYVKKKRKKNDENSIKSNPLVILALVERLL